MSENKRQKVSEFSYFTDLEKPEISENQQKIDITQIDDIRNELIKYLGPVEQLKLSSTNFTNYDGCCTNLMYEYKSLVMIDGMEYTLNNACEYGYLELVKYLCINNDEIHKDNDYAFRLSCANGNFDIAKYLYNLGGVMVETNVVFPGNCCGKKHPEDDSQIQKCNDLVFSVVCAYGFLDIAKWLMENFKIKALEGHSALHFACITKKYDILDWLLNFDIDPHLFSDRIFVRICITNNLEMAKWLYESFEFRLKLIQVYLVIVDYMCIEKRMLDWMEEKFLEIAVETQNQLILEIARDLRIPGAMILPNFPILED